ncbi:MAG: TlpA family protein disulfide reductase [Aureispira sp.]|nr:TlpA family protein disulfide reductase [Aureispira sp.]
MSRIVLYIIFCICIGQHALAQRPNVLLLGTIANNESKVVLLQVDKRYLNNTQEEYASTINEQGKFGIACLIELPQLVTLKYKKQEITLFLEPYDTLEIRLDGETFPNAITFGGRGKDNNELWQTFQNSFPQDNNLFHYRQYKRGSYYYKIHEDADALMRKNSANDYIQLLDRELTKKEMLAKLYTAEDDRRFTEGFLYFLQAEIAYDYWYKLLAYGDIFRYRVEETFLSFMDSIDGAHSLMLGSFKYREFVQAAVNYRCMQYQEKDANPYIQRYRYAQKQLTGRTRYFAMAYILNKALYKQPLKTVLPIYEDFIKDNPYFELDRLVLDAFQQANQFMAGTPAPNFELLNSKGKVVKLSDYKGKVVYLDFWATWCRPCMKKLEELKPLEASFEGKDIVFLHISLDASASTWQKTLQKKQFRGIHLLNNPETNLTRDYEVLSVPKFFLINKQGQFAYTPKSFDQAELIEALDALIAE